MRTPTEQESASEDQKTTCVRCGYTPRRKDKFYVEDFGVWHVICYECGNEYVE